MKHRHEVVIPPLPRREQVTQIICRVHLNEYINTINVKLSSLKSCCLAIKNVNRSCPSVGGAENALMLKILVCWLDMGSGSCNFFFFWSRHYI